MVKTRQDFPRLGINAIGHEGRNGARGIILARVAGTLEVVEDLLVDVAEVLALGQVVEIDDDAMLAAALCVWSSALLADSYATSNRAAARR
jgi:hypothetical protein